MDFNKVTAEYGTLPDLGSLGPGNGKSYPPTVALCRIRANARAWARRVRDSRFPLALAEDIFKNIGEDELDTFRDYVNEFGAEENFDGNWIRSPAW